MQTHQVTMQSEINQNKLRSFTHCIYLTSAMVFKAAQVAFTSDTMKALRRKSHFSSGHIQRKVINMRPCELKTQHKLFKFS